MAINTALSTDIVEKGNLIDLGYYRTGRFVERTFDNQNLRTQIDNSTNANIAAETTETNLLKAERIYPHLLDSELPEGEGLTLVKSALVDAQKALDAFDDPDMPTVLTHLTQIAATMGKAHPLTKFNESFGSVVSYIRRATLLASVDDICRSSLNSLITALQFLVSNPMLGLNEACEVIDNLSFAGWKGEHSVVEELISALFDNINIIESNIVLSDSEDFTS
jgi:hypothetical protein